jgi:hypothetical protein
MLLLGCSFVFRVQRGIVGLHLTLIAMKITQNEAKKVRYGSVFSDGWFYPHSFHLKLLWEFHDMGTSA